MTTTNDPLVGTTYDGRYRIEKRIGSGGMANVYCAEDETLGRRVAIKVLHQRYAEDSQFVQRFLREASAAARLSHPNIVQVYDRGQAGGSYYIAMEFIDGMTLKDLVRRRGALTEQEVLAYGRQALHALRSAHRNGIVHRDVKPHNMMVDTDGRLKIADFGIARAAADADQGLTEAGSIVGTAQYLSPEQAQGHEVAASSDLYSLGVVLFEMSTGRVPFDGDSPVNVALKHVKDPVPRPTSLNAKISPAVESIILKALEKDPSRRYTTADEMLADLDLARDGGTTSAMTQVMAGAAAPVDSIGATRVSPITPAAASARYNQPPVAPEPVWRPEWEDEDSEPARKRSMWVWLLPLLLVLILLGGAAWFAFGRDAGGGDPVPDVVGMTEAEARTAITDAGFTVGDPTTKKFSEDEPKGTVLEQSPDAGDEAKEGDTVELVVSNGEEPTPVPNVVGKNRGDALTAIRDAKFEPKVADERVASETVEKGFVVSQDPAANADLDEGEIVTITLSSGPESTKLDNVIGMSFDAAKSKLEAAGFEVEQGDEQDSSQAAGTVLKQSPSSGEDAAEGDTITLTVASGENTVPTLNGLSESDANAALRDAGFTGEASTQTVTDPAQDGVVISSRPGSGSRIEIESSVRFVVGRVEATTTPDETAPPVDDGTGDAGNDGTGTGTGNNGNATGQNRRDLLALLLTGRRERSDQGHRGDRH